MGNQTNFRTTLIVDASVVQDARYRFNHPERQYVDDQIRDIQQFLLDTLIAGKHATYLTLDGGSAAVAAGDTVCPASSVGMTVTKSTSSALATGKSVCGVVLLSASPGGRVLVAIGGMLPLSITGLSAVAGPVRVNPSTGRCQQVAALSASDYGIGTADAAGNLNVSISSGNIVSTIATTDATPAYATLATLAVGDVVQVDVVVKIAKSDGSVRQSFKLSAIYYGAAGPTATIDGTVSSTTAGTGAAAATLDVTGAVVRLKITGIAATSLVTTFEAHVL